MEEAKSINLYVWFSYQLKKVVTSVDNPGTLQRTLQLQCGEPFSHQFMPPFQRDAFLRGLKKTHGKTSGNASIAANETSTLMLAIKNTSAVKLEMISIIVDVANNKICSIRLENTSSAGSVRSFTRNLHKNNDSTFIEEQDHPGKSMSSMFHIHPFEASPSLSIGIVNEKWRRFYTEVAD